MPHLQMIRGRVEPFLALIAHDVKFMVFGGHAVNYHGVHRMANDLDIWVEPTSENAGNLRAALEEFCGNFRCDRIGEMSSVGKRFDLDPPYGYIQFFSSINKVSFEEAIGRAEVEIVEGCRIPFISKIDLITSKMDLDDPKDKADIEAISSDSGSLG